MLREGDIMELWALAVQYICAAAGAAAVVRWVDGCGHKKRTPPSANRKRSKDDTRH